MANIHLPLYNSEKASHEPLCPMMHFYKKSPAIFIQTITIHFMETKGRSTD